MALYDEEENNNNYNQDDRRYLGTIKNETTGDKGHFYSTLPVTPPTQQNQNTEQNRGGDINQFLEWAMKNKVGFNPFTMNPVTEAMKEFNSNESQFFNRVFAGRVSSTGNLTPEQLKYWNQERNTIMNQLIASQHSRQQGAISYLTMLKQGWEEKNTVTDKVTIDPATGQQVYTNKFGEIIKNPNIRKGGQTSQMVAGAGAPSSGTSMGGTQPTTGQSENLVKPPAAKEPKQLSQDSINQLSDMATTYDRLVDIGKKLADKPDLAGPLQGRLAALRVKFQNEGETQAVLNELKSLITIAYSLSGKQIGKEELKMLQEAMLPTLNQPHSNLMATISFARDWLAQTHNKRLEYNVACGYTHNIKPLLVGNQSPTEQQSLPSGWRRDANGVVYNDKGKKMVWRD